MSTTIRDERLISVFSLLMPVKKVLGQNRNWFILAVAIFVGGSLLAYTGSVLQGDSLPGFETQLGELQKLVEMILGSPPPIMMLIIFMKNFMALAQMLLLGVVAGISPLATLFLNGYVLGALAASYQVTGGSVPAMILFGILPHGIFELPAIFICAALGLKLGYHCIASPLPDQTRFGSFKHIWKEIVSVLPLVVALLVCAALIESFVTPLLMGGLG